MKALVRCHHGTPTGAPSAPPAKGPAEALPRGGTPLWDQKPCMGERWGKPLHPQNPSPKHPPPTPPREVQAVGVLLELVGRLGLGVRQAGEGVVLNNCEYFIKC